MSTSTQVVNTKALILAGGKGTRLRPLTYAMAKQLVPVANVPILHYALDSLYQAGIRDMGIVISPETGEAIRDSVTAWVVVNPDVSVTYILQHQPAGLAHAVKISRSYLGDSNFLMYLGDNLINADLRAHIQAFLASEADASILLKAVENPSSFGVVERHENGQIYRLVEKPENPPSNLALVGVYLFTASIFEAVSQIAPSGRGELEITDAIQYLVDHGYHVSSRIHEGWWLDTGKKDDLLAANQVVLSEIKQSAVKGKLDASSCVEGAVLIEEGAEILNSAVQGPSVIGRNCVLKDMVIGPYTSIGAGCNLSESLLSNSVILEGCTIHNIRKVISNSIIGKQCRIIGDSYQEDGMHQLLLADQSDIDFSQ